MSVDRAFLVLVVTLLTSVATALPGAAAAQGPVKVTGLITSRNGEVMDIRTAEGKTVEVVLNPDTKIDEPQGVFGFRKKDLNIAALAPGLNVTVQGLQYENNQLIAKRVTFSKQNSQSAHGAQSMVRNPVLAVKQAWKTWRISPITKSSQHTPLTSSPEAHCFPIWTKAAFCNWRLTLSLSRNM